MARVKNPLQSLSATGLIGNTLTYVAVAEQPSRIIHRRYNELDISAKYPARIVSGQGIVRLKIRKRRATKQRKDGNGLPIFPTQSDVETLFTTAGVISRWLVRHNLSVQQTAPSAANNEGQAMALGYLLGRGENREIRRFPGQPVGNSLAIRRNINAPITPLGYIMHLLLTKNFHRFVITSQLWNNRGRTALIDWAPSGDAPWHELPDIFTLPIVGRVNQTFINIWIQLSYLIPRFSLRKNWLESGQENALWIHPKTAEDFPAQLADYQDFINPVNDIIRNAPQTWSRST